MWCGYRGSKEEVNAHDGATLVALWFSYMTEHHINNTQQADNVLCVSIHPKISQHMCKVWIE